MGLQLAFQNWRGNVASPTLTLANLAFAAIAFLTVLALAGCGSNKSVNNAQLRILNLTVESGPISVLVDTDSTSFQSNIAFQSTTALKEISPGSRRLRVSNAGGVILDQTVSTLSQQKQLYVVFGGASSLGSVLLNNDISTSGSGNTRVRLINMAVGLGTYDFYVTPGLTDYLTVEPLVKNTAATTYELAAGTYTITLTAPNSKNVLFQVPTRALASQKYYNLALYNIGSGQLPSAFWLAQDDDSAPEFLTSPVTRVRAANSQPGTSTVNVSIGGNRIFTNVPFGGISTYSLASSGAQTISYVDTSDTTKTYTLNSTLDGASDYSTFLAANTSGPSSVFQVADRILPATTGKVRIRLVNASTVPDLSLALSFTAVTPPVAIRSASNYFEVVGGVGTPVTITQGAGAAPVLNLAGTDLAAGGTYSIVVSGVAGTLQITPRQDN